MSKLYSLLFLLLLFGCSPSETNKKSEDKPLISEDKTAPIKEDGKIETLTQSPEGIKTLGDQFITGRKWNDANGENLLLFTFFEEVKPHPSGDEATSRALYAEHFARKEATQVYTLVRKVQDFEKDCILENMLHLEEKSIQITDLDKNKYNELSFVYTLGCRSDISTDPMKLILLENGEKYAVRGNTRSKYSLREEKEPLPESTDKTFDPSFEKAPAVFKQFANKLWNAHELKQ